MGIMQCSPSVSKHCSLPQCVRLSPGLHCTKRPVGLTSRCRIMRLEYTESKELGLEQQQKLAAQLEQEDLMIDFSYLHVVMNLLHVYRWFLSTILTVHRVTSCSDCTQKELNTHGNVSHSPDALA